MRNIFLLCLFLFFSKNAFSQDRAIVSDLENLKLDIGQLYKPVSDITFSDGRKEVCNRVIYYQKKGVFSSGKSITFDRAAGTIKANEPGTHEVIAVCIDSNGRRLTKAFSVFVNYPKVKEVKLSVNENILYEGNYVPLSYEITDELNNIRKIDYWNYDDAFKYFLKAEVSLKASNDNIKIDGSNNILAFKEGATTLFVSFDGVTAKIELKIKKNPVSKLYLTSDAQNVRSGDVINFRATSFDNRGKILENIPVQFSFTGKAFDKSNSASGLVMEDGRFVGDVPGKYVISARVGNVSASKIVNIFPRNIKREVISVGSGLVNDKHTSDFWIFEGVDGGDYGVTGTWGADGTAYFWDVSDPANLKKIDSVQVDARTVNDVKVSKDGKICVISREGASSRKNGIILIDVTNPKEVKIISEYTKNLTGGVHNVFIDNNHVYALSNAERYYVINIDDTKNPKEVGMFELGKQGQSIHDVWIENGIAYSSNWSDGVYLVDVGNGVAGGSPSNPVSFGNYSYASGAHHATFPYKSKSTGKFYTVLGDEIFPKGVNSKGTNETAGFLHFVDFSDINNPVEAARYELPGHGSHNYWIEDDILYVAMYTGGLRIVDLSGDLLGDLYKQGREIGYLLTGTPDGYIPNDTMVWGAQLYKDHVFYSDFNSGLGVAKVSTSKPDSSKTNQHLD
tara:strand:- start:348 stop:2384 length:2037 start_codon:yes stop_codon:yes gene_type:complete